MDFRIIAKLARFKEIVMTLLKYGFDDLVQRLDLPGTALVKKST
jgi:ubiquinone biosynthesis protein